MKSTSVSLLLPIALALLGSATVAAQTQTPPRGEPIKPLAPKGQPIKPITPAQPAADPAPALTLAPSSSAAPSVSADGVTMVGFDKLSAFKYEVPEEGTGASASAAAPATDPDTQIPESVKAYNGKRVSLKGFMLPLKVEQGLVTELLIMRDQSMCCYGAVPKINEWVSVRMTSKGVKPVMDQAITMQGTLKVGAIRENGYLVGIYQMDGEKMDGPTGL
ncbi:MAG: DUF3299 domain-containing protein [Verrucomicrobiae bacterium]|nr:DUF3299 domain-containing protein [Verrucomicrobiae bacterium]